MNLELRAPESVSEWDAYHTIRERVLWEARGRVGVYDRHHPDEFEADNHPLLLFDGLAPVGVVRIDVRGAVAFFRRVAIREDRQREGLGTAMMAMAEDFVKDQGVSVIRSNVDSEATGFYLKMGFECEDRTDDSQKGLPMQKVLG